MLRRRWFQIVLIIVVGLVLSLLSSQNLHLLENMGKTDFRAYWSASYLLSQGDDFSSEVDLLRVQREATGWDLDYGMKTWNPPWVLVWLLPYTAIDFKWAASLWLLSNIIFLTITIAGSWRLFDVSTEAKRSLWLPLIVAAFFPSTIVSLLFGQTNLLVSASIVGFLLLYKVERDSLAGTVLAFSTIKPHLVYLTLPLIFVSAIKSRRWRVLGGFLSVLIVSLAVAVVLRPTLFNDYLQSNSGGHLLLWESSTLVTFLSLKSGWLWVRLIGVVLLPLVCLFWWRFSDRIDFIEAVEITLFLSLITAPFGWSYDFVVLLLPLAHILFWILYHFDSHFERTALVVALLLLYLVYYNQRVASPSELYYYWVTLALAALYAWTRYRAGPERNAEIAFPEVVPADS